MLTLVPEDLVAFLLTEKTIWKGWRDGPTVTIKYCSCRGLVWFPTPWSIAWNSSSRGPYALFWPPWTSELLYVHTKKHTIKNKVFEGLHSSIYAHDAVVIYISSTSPRLVHSLVQHPLTMALSSFPLHFWHLVMSRTFHKPNDHFEVFFALFPLQLDFEFFAYFDSSPLCWLVFNQLDTN